MNKKSKSKQEILDFLKGGDGATYADMQGALDLARATLRRWVMELERDGLVTRTRAHSRARAVFTAYCKTCNDKEIVQVGDGEHQVSCPDCCNL